MHTYVCNMCMCLYIYTPYIPIHIWIYPQTYMWRYTHTHTPTYMNICAHTFICVFNWLWHGYSFFNCIFNCFFKFWIKNKFLNKLNPNLIPSESINAFWIKDNRRKIHPRKFSIFYACICTICRLKETFLTDAFLDEMEKL